jgi:pyrimidine-nucleoside phosphorylase
MHAVDVIRRKRDGLELSVAEIEFMVRGAAEESLPPEQISAWLMAVWLRGMSLNELRALTQAMRFSGEVIAPFSFGKKAVDKHSTGGVGDKTSFLVAPIAAAAGLAVPMISGRALGHTGGTLDKLETIPGYRTLLSPAEFRSVIDRTGACIMGQTNDLVPADRVLYAMRDRTATVESSDLICASIMSKKLAEGLDGLVLDVKTGSGSSLRDDAASLRLASLMVQIGEASGTRTIALVTGMDQPLGRAAGNWIEIAEAVGLLRGEIDPMTEDLRSLSLSLAGWMIYLGDKSDTPESGREMAEHLLESGAAYQSFLAIVHAQGGDLDVMDKPADFHKPGMRKDLVAKHSGILTDMDCAKVGWAVQRLGAGREREEEAVDANAGLYFHAKLGSEVNAGDPICTMFAARKSKFAEPQRLLRSAIRIENQPYQHQPLIRKIISIDNAAQFQHSN